MERYTKEEFWERFGRIEHEALEFKRELPTRQLDTVPAMAMTDGGTILLGIDDKTHDITGCEMSQQDYDRITNTIMDRFNMEVKIRPIQVGSTEITAIEVPAIRDRLITTSDGRLLRRVGGNQFSVGISSDSKTNRRGTVIGSAQACRLRAIGSKRRNIWASSVSVGAICGIRQRSYQEL